MVVVVLHGVLHLGTVYTPLREAHISDFSFHKATTFYFPFFRVTSDSLNLFNYYVLGERPYQ
jgi:hypothetical protein